MLFLRATSLYHTERDSKIWQLEIVIVISHSDLSEKKLFTVWEMTEPHLFDDICIAVFKLYFIVPSRKRWLKMLTGVPCRERWLKLLTDNSHTSEVLPKADLALSIDNVQ